MVQIVIPMYNHAEALNECLSSLYKQTLSIDKIIVVNDGSTDDPEAVVKRWVDKLPIVYISQQNAGACAARNRGFQECRSEVGDFVMFCDADVVMKVECLQKMKKALDDYPEASFSYSSFMFGLKKFACGAFTAERLRKMPFITTTSLIRAHHFPGFDEALTKFQDWDLWLTMLSRGHPGVWVDEVLFSATPRASGMSTWLPSFFYKMPWPIFGYIPDQIKKYRVGKQVIANKHGLSF